MNEAPALVLAGVMGALLGTFFYGGLWLTVRKALPSKHAAVWFLGSTLLRLGLTMAGVYLVSRAHWERLPPCLLGFFVASVIVTRWAPTLRAKPAGEATDASQS